MLYYQSEYRWRAKYIVMCEQTLKVIILDVAKQENDNCEQIQKY